MQCDMFKVAAPALGPAEASLMPAMCSGNHFIPVGTPAQTPAPSQQQGSAAGRAVLSARGISLPGVSAMGGHLRAASGAAAHEQPTYDIDCIIKTTLW